MNRLAVALVITVAALTGCSAAPAPPKPAAAAPTPVPSSIAPPRGTAPSGSFRVEVRRLRLTRGADRPLPTTIWYPARGKGPFPVIVFSHGLGTTPGDYGDLLTRWARAGFVVAAPAYPHTSSGVADFDVLDLVKQPADASYVLSKVLALGAKSGDPLRGRLDPAHVAAAGHSGGAITTIGMLSSERDERLSAAVLLSGRQVLPVPFTGERAPVLFVHGKLDRTIRYADGLAAFDALPWPKAMLTLPNGGHVTTGGRDFDVVSDTTTDFWRWSLYGDAAAKQRLARRPNLRDEL
jgi:dienelactone hydrolase